MRESRALNHEVFGPIAATYLERDDVDIGAMFGSDGLRVRGKIFAFISYTDEVVMKLPADRIDALECEGVAQRMVMRERPMREWAVIDRDAADRWPELVGEAFAFVDALTPRRGEPRVRSRASGRPG